MTPGQRPRPGRRKWEAMSNQLRAMEAKAKRNRTPIGQEYDRLHDEIGRHLRALQTFQIKTGGVWSGLTMRQEPTDAELAQIREVAELIGRAAARARGGAR